MAKKIEAFNTLINLWYDCRGNGKFNIEAIPQDKASRTSYNNMFTHEKLASIPKDDLHKAYKLLIDEADHQWHLNSGFIKQRDEALKIIADNKLWEAELDSSNFESVCRYVENLLKIDGQRISGITQLTWYDVSLRLIIVHSWNCLPDMVYVHALPGRTSKRILNIYYDERKNKECEIINPSIYEPLFPSLKPFEVEWILCDIGKAIRHYKKTGKPRQEPWKKFDEEVIRLIKAGKI